jgi:iron complex transport system ATP-binding protein
VLRAHALSLSLSGRTILDRIDLEIRPGAVTAVIGPNGAGKSTLLSCLAGLRRPDAGEATLDGQSLTRMNPRRRARRLAFMEQSPEVAWPVTVRTLVGLGRAPFTGARGLGAEDRAAVDAAMARTGVTGFADRLATTLSGGERARALIARALAGRPRWLLADEPLTGLDIGHQLDALTLFRSLAAEGAGVVATLHDLTLAARLADRLVVLAEGRVAASGPPDEVLTPSLLAEVYGIEAGVLAHPGGLTIDLIGRRVGLGAAAAGSSRSPEAGS